MNFTWPNPIPPDGKIGIFSPSEPLWDSRSRQVANGIEILESHGFKVALAPNAMASRYDAAGTVDQRLSDLHTLLRDPSIAALGGSWGGKAANQLLRNLDYALAARAKKPLFGFSDVAVLLNVITAKTGLVTFFGPNVVGKLGETEFANLGPMTDPRRSYGSNPFVAAEHYGDWNSYGQRTGCGRLFGGNLSTFVLGPCAMYLADVPDEIVFFWESSGELPQLIKQHLTSLLNTGFLDRVGCMIIGDVRWPPDEYEHQNVIDAVRDVLGDRTTLVVSCPTFGHAQLRNPIIPIGGRFEFSPNASECRLVEESL